MSDDHCLVRHLGARQSTLVILGPSEARNPGSLQRSPIEDPGFLAAPSPRMTNSGLRLQGHELLAGPSPRMTDLKRVDQPSIFRAARKADCGISTRPNWRIFLASLLVQQLLPAHVAAIALGSHVLAERADSFARQPCRRWPPDRDSKSWRGIRSFSRAHMPRPRGSDHGARSSTARPPAHCSPAPTA